MTTEIDYNPLYRAISKPYLQDRWEDQVAIEREMLATGRGRMDERIQKATEKGDLTRLRPHQTLLRDFVEPVAEHLKAWIDGTATRRGPKPIALPRLQELDPYVSALIGLRSALRLLGQEQRMVMAMAYEIGTWIEHEVEALAWMEHDPKSWMAMERQYQDRGATTAHVKRSRVAIFNKHVSDRIDYEPWSEEERRRVGLQVIDSIVQGTGRFQVVAEPRPDIKSKWKWPMMLQPDPELSQWLATAMDDERVFSPVYLPTVIKPKAWEGPKDGGYWTPFVKSPFLIRFKASHETQRQRAIDEFEAVDMPLVYDALNYVQDTGWRVNKRVLDVAQRMWDLDLGLGIMPTREAEIVPPKPEDESEEVQRAWRKVAGETKTRNATKVSKVIAARRVLQAANRMSREDSFWFPHRLDFRGRMYPIPSDLSPQGDDLHKGLLEFSEGKAVGEVGGAWLAIQLANTFGVDKVDFQDRINWVAARDDMWRSIDADPMSDRRWTEADGGEHAWEALAAIFDYAGFLREGDAYVSHAPIRVDGTCNGIQHLAAMCRDKVVGAQVNLVPGERPADIYTEVGIEVLERLVESEGQSKYADMWLAMFSGRVPRGVTKRPVMILPYGGTTQAYLKYTREWLTQADPHGIYIPEDDRSKALGYLVSVLWKAVSKSLPMEKAVMDWLQDCAKLAARSGNPLYWVTPVGFVVRHFYGVREAREIETKIDGQRLQLTVWETTPTLDVTSQLTGIAPNFVHSMDASTLMSTALLVKDAGVSSMTTIHDSFGTHAADMWTLFECVREAFVQTYRRPVLEEFLQACKEVAPNVKEKDWPALPPFGDLELEGVYTSDYFFS